jgi:hypothetical protein
MYIHTFKWANLCDYTLNRKCMEFDLNYHVTATNLHEREIGQQSKCIKYKNHLYKLCVC